METTKQRKNPSKVNRSEAASLYADGWTLKQLGDRYGVTRERVRQTLIGLVDSSRPRKLSCKRCGKTVMRSGPCGQGVMCSDECRDAESHDREFSSKCKCGKQITSGSKQCHNCRRTCDHGLVEYLYVQGASTVQIATTLETGGPGHLVMLLHRRGVMMHRMGYRSPFSLTDVRRLAKEYRASEK